MKCLSLWQPWATLVAIGAKRIETRSWPTLHRGPIAIHAAKHWDRHQAETCCIVRAIREALMPTLWPDGMPAMELGHLLPRGKIIAIGNLTDCKSVAQWVRIPEQEMAALGGDEEQLGDYSPGRFGWRLSDIKPLPTPIPYSARQRLFDIPDRLFAGGENP